MSIRRGPYPIDEPAVHPEGSPDRPTVDAAGERISTEIEGVLFRALGPLHADHRGTLLEVVDLRNEFWAEPVVYAYRITVRPGRVKGWGMHRLQTDRYLVTTGRLRVVLYDARTASPTFGRFAQFHFTDETPGLVSIPPGVWHADQNYGDVDAVLLNFPTRPYDHAAPDKYRIDPASGEIPFDWELRDFQ